MFYSLVCVDECRKSRFPILFFINNTTPLNQCFHVSIHLYFFHKKSLKTYPISRAIRKPVFAYAKTKTQINCAVTTADLRLCFHYMDSTISLLLKCQASSHLMRFNSSVCVGTPKTGFLMTRLSYKTIIGQRNNSLSK